MQQFKPQSRSRVRRHNDRASYDAETVYSILDSHFLCHIAFVFDGHPQIIPTCHWREGNRLYWHGSAASRMMKHMADGNTACVSVTQLDGLVLARSAFSTSVNYRSVLCYGQAEKVEGPVEFDRQMELFFEKLAKGRWQGLRPITNKERKATMMLVMDIEEAATKIRAAGPGDSDEADWPIWAGTVPIFTAYGAPEPASEGARAPLSHGLFDTYGWQRG